MAYALLHPLFPRSCRRLRAAFVAWQRLWMVVAFTRCVLILMLLAVLERTVFSYASRSMLAQKRFPTVLRDLAAAVVLRPE